MEINIGQNTHNWCRANANMENHYTLFSLSLCGINVVFMTPASSTVCHSLTLAEIWGSGLGWRLTPRQSGSASVVGLASVGATVLWETPQWSGVRPPGARDTAYCTSGKTWSQPPPLPPHNIVWLFTLRCLNPMLRQSWRYLLFSNRSLIVSVSLTLFP